jgi:ankyrin repeat protein
MVQTLIAKFESAGRIATALGEAARWGRVDLLEKLFKSSSLDVDARNEFDCTSLMLAASAGQTKAIKYLLDRGADVNAIGGADCTTPLISAVAAPQSKRAYIQVCKLLLESGATRTIDHRDRTGKTALDWAKDGRPAELITLIEKHDSSVTGPPASPQVGSANSSTAE